ncbi:glycosyltransferase family 2 protein [Patescibacteria group bacterium]|nr:glycosyltransferase family 2 protein [Patescibacteria group bacterium]MBU1966857.1 glycosyltransferase family 2 protein [Patescibacteria group bacterium]MBU2543526.1 glycosyltransferase family 2 protein [Patescibacteria group bacterium]
MTLTIIIVSYNTKDLTLQTIETAWKDAQSSPSIAKKTEIIIVDNNSKDGTVTTIKNTFESKNIKVIANKHNKGFASANNQGIKIAKGKYIILLNSDTIVQKGSLATLVNTFERFPLRDSTSTLVSQQDRIDKLGILAPTLLNPDGTLQPQGGDLPTLFALFNHMSFLDDLPIIGKFLPSTQHTGFRQNEKLKYHTHDTRLIKRGWVGGTAMMIRKEVIQEIGLLDDAIFMYGEDTEYCMRASHHHFDVAIDPEAKITHFGQASSSSANAIRGEFKSYLYNWSKHKPLWQIPLVKMILKMGMILRVIAFTTLRPDGKRRAIYQDLLSQI